MSFGGRLETHLEERERSYTGAELRPHFLLTELGLRGHAVGAFIGPCSVATEQLVDWEDRLQGDRLEARRMVHFIGEFFGIGLREGVVLQRLFMSMIGATVGASIADRVVRRGDDVFVRGRKLTVSIVTASPVSVLLHAGVNVNPEGAPVPAIGLAELGIEEKAWVSNLLEAFREEWSGLDWACAKVRPVL